MVSLLVYFNEREVTPPQDPGQTIFRLRSQQRSPHKPPSLQLKQPSSIMSGVHNKLSTDTETTTAVLRALARRFWTGSNCGPATSINHPSTG